MFSSRKFFVRIFLFLAVFLILINTSYAIEKNVAYLISSALNKDSFLISELQDLGFKVTVILENQVSSTDFSLYDAIIVGNTNFKNPQNIPIYEHKTIVINSYDYAATFLNSNLGLSSIAGTASSPTTVYVRNGKTIITEGLPEKFSAYTLAMPDLTTAYLKGKKPKNINIIISGTLSSDAILATIEPGSSLLNNKIAKQRIIFFGITQAKYWTPESKLLFKNAIKWLMGDNLIDGNSPPTFKAFPVLNLDEGGSITLNLSEYVYDSDSNKLVFTAESSSSNDKIIAEFTSFETIKFTSILGWEGEDWIIVSAFDGKNKVLSPKIYLNVSSKIILPSFKENISNFNLDENTMLIRELNLNHYFNTGNYLVNFNVIGNDYVKVIIESSGLVSFIPKKNWNGKEEIYFIVTFSEKGDNFVISSNNFSVTVRPKDDIPEFAPFSCETEIKSNLQYECPIRVYDTENDTLELKIIESKNSYCSIEGSNLVYRSFRDFSGEANCVLEVKDKDGFDRAVLKYNVTLKDENNPSGLQSLIQEENVFLTDGEKKRFFFDSIKASNVKWILDSQIVEYGDSYEYIGRLGEHEIIARGIIDNKEQSKIWKVKVTPNALLTGKNRIDNLSLSDAIRCNQKNNSLSIQIKSPSSNKEFLVSDLIDIKSEIQNNLNIEQFISIETYFYDLTDDKVIKKIKDNLDLNVGQRKTIEHSIILGDDLNTYNDYVIFVKAYGEICNEEYKEIKIEELDHHIIINSLIIPDDINCNNDLTYDLKLSNFGKEDEKISIIFENEELNISEELSPFIMEAKEDKKTSKRGSINLPQIDGRYTFNLMLSYNNETKIYPQNVRIICPNLQTKILSDFVSPEFSVGEESLGEVEILERNIKLNTYGEKAISISYLFITILIILNILLILTAILLKKNL